MFRARLIPLSFMLVLYAGAPLLAQSTEARQESAAARDDPRVRFHGNLINFSSGEVTRVSGGSKTTARAGQELQSGDALQVNQGRAEVLLNPGYYLRLGDKAEVELLDLSPGNLKMKLSRGAVIFEIANDTWYVNTFLSEWKEHLFNIVTLITPRDELAIVHAGAYRFDVMSDDRCEIKVIKGRLAIPGHMMKDKTKASVLSGRVVASAFDEKSGDDFDNWSRERAKALIQSNKSLKKRKWFKELSEQVALLEGHDPEAAKPKGGSRLLSARGGAVEFAEDGISIMRSGSSWQDLKSGEQLAGGDRLRTAPYARAELRPYPDYYLFVDGGTEIAYSENEQGEVTVLVTQGSVILQVPRTPLDSRERNDFLLKADNAEYHIRQNGYFRLTVPAPRQSELTVRYGRVKTSTQEIRAPNSVLSILSGVNVTPFDRNILDSFDVWGDHRVARYVNLMAVAPRLRRIWFAAAWFLDEQTNEFTLVGGGLPYKSPYGGEYSSVYTLEPNTRR